MGLAMSQPRALGCSSIMVMGGSTSPCRGWFARSSAALRLEVTAAGGARLGIVEGDDEAVGVAGVAAGAGHLLGYRVDVLLGRAQPVGGLAGQRGRQLTSRLQQLAGRDDVVQE